MKERGGNVICQEACDDHQDNKYYADKIPFASLPISRRCVRSARTAGIEMK